MVSRFRLRDEIARCKMGEWLNMGLVLRRDTRRAIIAGVSPKRANAYFPNNPQTAKMWGRRANFAGSHRIGRRRTFRTLCLARRKRECGGGVGGYSEYAMPTLSHTPLKPPKRECGEIRCVRGGGRGNCEDVLEMRNIALSGHTRRPPAGANRGSAGGGSVHGGSPGCGEARRPDASRSPFNVGDLRNARGWPFRNPPSTHPPNAGGGKWEKGANCGKFPTMRACASSVRF